MAGEEMQRSTFTLNLMDEVNALNYFTYKIVFTCKYRLILLENSRSTNEALGKLQDLLDPIVAPNSKGCRWNVNVPNLVQDAKLVPVQSESKQMGTLFLGIYRLPTSS